MHKYVLLLCVVLSSGFACAQSAVPCVNRYVKPNINQNQFDALVDFTFNVGCGNFRKSTLLALVNKGDFNKASLEFAKWRLPLVNGKPLPGIIKRRSNEKAMFLKPAL